MTALDFYYHFDYNIVGPPTDNVSLILSPLIEKYATPYTNTTSGIGIDPINPDVPNGIFATRQDVINYAVSTIAPTIVSSINGNHGTSYTLGSLIPMNLELANAMATKQPKATPVTHIADAPTDAPTNAATNAPTNAPTDARTDYGVLAAILGADVNAANGKQNTTAGNVNSVATIVNANATKQNTIATKVNDGFTKMNSVLDALEANSFVAA